MQIRIYYEDTDAGGIVYHTNYLKYCERARSELFFKYKFQTFSADRHFVVTKIEAKYLKAAALGDTVEVRTSVDNIKKASVVLKQEIYKISDINGEKINQLLFSALISVAYLEYGKPKKMDDIILRLFYTHNK